MTTVGELCMPGWTFPLVKIDGVVEMKTLTEKLKTMKSRPVREDDIFLCTYPKSGTHWTWEILNMIVAGKAEYAKHWKNSAALERMTEEGMEELASPRIIQTHLLPSQMPEMLWERRCKVVYVQRNPKDCAVSYFCHMSQQVRKDNPTQQVTFTGSWDEFLSFFMDGSVPLGSIFHHTNAWKNVSSVHEGLDICYVQYEDMKQDCVAQIRRISEYLDRPHPEDIYQEIAEACSFENLKIASEKIKDQTYHNPWQEGSSGYFRKGQTGDWKNWFTVAQSEECDRKYELEMTKAAYSLVHEEFCKPNIVGQMAAKAEVFMQGGWTFPLVKIDGVVELKTVTESLKTMKSRPVREDDIFLCSYPKSGTHWTWEMLHMIVAGKAEYTKHWKNSTALERRTEEELEELASPRIIQTHLLPRQMPELLWERKCKVVYVQRNPKDCAVSYFCHMSQQVRKDNPTQQVTFTGSWDEFLSFFMDGSVPFGSIVDHVMEWENVSSLHKGFEICSVKYEDMKQDSVAQIRRMAEYLNRPLPEGKYQEIAEACSFKNLKNVCEKTKDQTYHNPWQEGSSGYFRKGQIDDWKNWFTVAQSEEFDRKYQLKMKKNPHCGCPV
ncbi:uncharacterized protein [Haliotis asinina]|uniref:uncharacterized protein n=1 Tax=Haliotis asinina TaxID=109174 RepID=UPI003531E637